MSALLEWTGSVRVCGCGNVYSPVCACKCIQCRLYTSIRTHLSFFLSSVPFFSKPGTPPLFLPSPQICSSLRLSPVHPSLLSVQFRILPLPPQHWSPNLLSDPPAGTVLNNYTAISCSFPGIYVDIKPVELKFLLICAQIVIL